MAKVKGALFAHPLLMGVALVAVVATASGLWAWHSMFGLSQSVVSYGVPDAPHLTARNADQIVYRIDPTRSEVSYEIDENLAGQSHTATGTTKSVAGDIRVDFADPSRTKVGEIVVNVQQLSSDEQLRDERIRHDFLQSDTYPLATFAPTRISGLPDEIVEGTAYDVGLVGDLTVKETTAPVRLDATVTRQDDELTIHASTTVKLSDFDIGPIHVIGLASAGDDVTLSFDLVAQDVETLPDLTQVVREDQAISADDADNADDSPSFHDAVMPVLEQHCASCHEPGAPGAGVWQLEAAGDAQRVASGLGLAVETRYMPPWLASGASVPFKHDMRLSDDEIAAVTQWADAGGPLDVDADTPVEATHQSIRHARADIEMTADAAYQGSTALQNDYRCLVMDPHITEPTVITGHEFVPDQVPYVHHALVYRMSADMRQAIDERDAADDGTGYRCFGGVGGPGRTSSPTGSGGGTDLVAGWAPGVMPALYPRGTGMLVEPGEFFVMQVHYHFAHAAPPDRSKLVLQVGDQPIDSYDLINVTTYLAPAEIPCGPDDSGPLCDRDAAIADLIEQYGPSAAFTANGLNSLCGTTPEQLGVLDGTIARSSCDHVVFDEGQILGVHGHMHGIGATFRMTLNPDTPDERVLLDIPRWDFNWQLNYAPRDDIELHRGDVIRVECSWDRSLMDPAHPNRYVLWAEGTEDEMCYSTITTREPAAPTGTAAPSD